MLYYREQKELINPQLRALEKKKKITKPPAFARAPKTNQIINFGARPVQSIRVFCACARNQSSNQLWGALTLITRQHAAPSPLFIAWGSPPSSFVYQQTTSPSLLSRQGPTHPSTPFAHGGLGVQPLASVWTFGDNLSAFTTLFAPDKSWDNVPTSAAPYTESRLAHLVRNKCVGFPVVEQSKLLCTLRIPVRGRRSSEDLLPSTVTSPGDHQHLHHRTSIASL
jgi:hypothetical protein